MHHQMDWSEPLLEKLENGETIEKFPADQLDRAKYAEFLTNYLVEEGQNNGYVLNLNARWGTGKTYFLNRWKAGLDSQYPVVYIDAWKQDYSDDPLLTVVSSIIAQLQSQAGDAVDEFVIKKAEKAARLFKAIAPALTKGVIAKLTGIKVDEIQDQLQEDSEDSNHKLGDLGLGDASGKLIQTLIDDHNAKLQGMDAFKESMLQWIEAVVGKGGKSYPAFVFIDELDRCRPSYAVEMLEVIKHFFEMQNVVFVVATDTEQLQHAVKAVYGSEFNAATYLGRFFRRRCTLKEISRGAFISQKVSQQNIEIDKLTSLIWPDISEGVHRYTEILSNTADAFYLSLRDVEQLVDKVNVIIQNLNGERINLYHLISLLIIHDKYHDFYQCYMSNRKHSGPSGNIYDYSTVSHYLNDVNINNLVDVSLKPSVYFHDGMVKKNNIGYGLDFNDQICSIRFNHILQKQMEFFLSGYGNNHWYDAIAQKRARSLGVTADDIMMYEISRLKPSLSKYQDWVELAATFDE